MRNRLPILMLLLCLAMLSGCQDPVALNGIRRVAVLTAEADMGPRFLGVEIKQELLARLPRVFILEAVDGVPFEAQLPPGGRAGNLPLIAERCREQGVDAFILTVVTAYQSRRDGNIDILDPHDSNQRRPGLELELSVELAFTASLYRAEDCSLVFSRNAYGRSLHTITLDPKRPLLSLNLLLEPHYDELRREAIADAVRRLTREAARAYGKLQKMSY